MGLARQRGQIRPHRAWLGIPGILILLILMIAPLLLMARFSFNRFTPGEFMVEAFTASNYLRFFTDTYYLSVLGTTILVSAGSAAVALVFGFPVAYVITRSGNRAKSALIILVLFPILVVTVVRAAGWVALLQSNGILNSLLVGIGVFEEPHSLLYNIPALILSMGVSALPYMALSIYSVLDGVPHALTEAARGLGASPTRVVRHVLLPLAAPGILVGSIFSFILCMNAYSAPVLVGGSSVRMLTPLVYSEISEFGNWPFGAAMAFILMVASLSIAAVATLLLERRIARRMVG